MPDEPAVLIPRMKSALPEFVSDDAMMGAYFDAVAPEIQLIQSEVRFIPRQMWPHLVSAEGIGRLETIYGLHPNESLTLDERRKLVLTKMLAMRTITVQVMRDLIADLSNDQAVISYYPRQHQAWVKMVVDYGKPAYLDALQAAISYYLPAHLEPHYLIYGQLTWSGMRASGAAWQDLPATTWANLPLWNRGQHRLLWLELRQNVYKHGEVTWGQLNETGSTWASLASFDPNSLSRYLSSAHARGDEDGYLRLAGSDMAVRIDESGFFLANYGEDPYRLRVDDAGYLWVKKEDV